MVAGRGYHLFGVGIINPHSVLTTKQGQVVIPMISWKSAMTGPLKGSFGHFGQPGKGLGVIDGQFGQDLTVNLHSRFSKPMYEAVIG